MLSLAEYRAAAAQLLQLGLNTDQQVGQKITDATKLQAIKIARDYADDYQTNFTAILQEAMLDAAQTAGTYYNKQLGLKLDTEKIANKVFGAQWQEKYWGATLTERMVANKRRLIRTIVQSAQIGKEHVAGVYSQAFPYGMHTNIDKRVLLSTMIKIEQDMAKEIADQANIDLIRWTLSHRHTVPDICDDLANNIDPKVVLYLRTKGLNIDPRGLYLKDDLPRPPHPNCQCEFMMVTPRGKQQTRGPVERTFLKVITLLRKFRRK